jgi:hypothetical protein
MITIATDHPGWRIINRTDNSADVLARAAPGTTEPPSRWYTLELLRDADGTLSTVRQPDGHFQWQLSTPDGRLIAESPAVYRDEAARLARCSVRTGLGRATRTSDTSRRAEAWIAPPSTGPAHCLCD